MFKHQVSVRVRYAETDQMGYVYYGNYATWFEVGRVEALRALGIAYRDLEEQGVMLPVASYSIDFLAPVRYDEVVTIETTIEELPNSRIHFTYLCKVAEQVVTRAKTTLFFMNRATGKPTRCPEAISIALLPFFPPRDHASE